MPTSLPSDAVQYAVSIIYQLESGEAGTPHYQGYVRFNRQRNLTHVRRFLPRAHWEPAKGTVQQNLDYCGKPDGRIGEPVILGFGGLLPGRGGVSGARFKRSDFITYVQENPHVSVSELLDKGGLEVLATQPNLLGVCKGLLLENSRRDGIVCRLYYGDTGCGKSRLAVDLFPAAFRKGSGPWWDGYAGETEVILDDFDSAFMPIGEFLRTVDRYPLRVPVKGGFVQLVANTFIITSNHLPREWYPDAEPKRLAAVERRIDTISIFLPNGREIMTYRTPDYLHPLPMQLLVGDRELLPWVDDRPWSPPLFASDNDDNVTPTFPMYPQ